MIVSGDNFGYSFETDSHLNEMQKAAEKRHILKHYTSIKTLKEILTNNTLLFNRIDKMNDEIESKLFSDIEVSKLIYVSCFSHSKLESIPMWKIYSNETGVCLEFEIKGENFIKQMLLLNVPTINPTDQIIYPYDMKITPPSDWYATFHLLDITYDIKLANKYSIKNGSLYILPPMGAIKRKEWSYEEESRMILTLRTTKNNVEIPDIPHFLVPISFENIKKMSITFNPWCNDKDICDVKLFMESFAKKTGVECTCHKSILHGELSFAH